MKELEEKFDENEEFSDGADQEAEEETRQISEQVDGMVEYQQSIALSFVNYKDYMRILKNLNASLNYSKGSHELHLQLKKDPQWQDDENSDYSF